MKEHRVVVFHPYSSVGDKAAMVREVMAEWLEVYGTVRLRKTTAVALDAPAGGALLYTPLALLKMPPSYQEYLAKVGHHTRNAIRKAERLGYEFKEFAWNDHLDAIHKINTSKDVRQSMPMRGWYRERVQPRYHSMEELQYLKYYGAFKGADLYAYLHLWICGDFGITKHIIGHAEYLTHGIMNGLISHVVRECVANTQVRWLEYGAYEKGSLTEFKKHAGFQKYALVVDLDGDQELLGCAERMVKKWRPI